MKCPTKWLPFTRTHNVTHTWSSPNPKVGDLCLCGKAKYLGHMTLDKHIKK